MEEKANGVASEEGSGQVSEKDTRKFKLDGKTLKVLRTVNLYMSFMALGLCLSIFGPTLLDLQRAVNTDAATIGYIYVARSIGYIVGSLIGGIVLDCLNIDQIILTFSSFFMTICIFFIPVCSDLTTLLVIMAIGGFFMGMLNTGTNVCCLNTWGEKGAPYFQGLHFFFGVGGFIGPLIVAYHLGPSQKELYETDMQETVLSATLGALNTTLSAHDFNSVDVSGPDNLTTYLSTKLTSVEDFNLASWFSAAPSIFQVYLWVSTYSFIVTSSNLFMLLFSKKEKNSNKKSENNVNNEGTIFIIVVVCLTASQTCLISAVELAFSQLLTSYVVRGPHKLSKATGSYMTSAYWGSFTITRALSVFISCKISIVKLIIFDLIATVSASMVLLCFSQISVLWLWVGSILLGIGAASFFPAAVSWMERYITVTNKIASVFTVVSSLGEMIVPVIIGKHIETFPNALFIFQLGASGSCCCIFLILYFILRRKKEKYAEEDELNR